MHAVCAAVGNADAAFELYAAMKAEGVKTEAQVGSIHVFLLLHNGESWYVPGRHVRRSVPKRPYEMPI